jgi:putative membrane-bound dehydrogenase-like protein
MAVLAGVVVTTLGLLHVQGTAADQEPTLTVPPGFEVERVAGPPLVNRPIVADFDEEGRLYVADSSGSNDKVEKQLEEKPHRIVRLEDRNGDGRFDTTVVFADRMMFPEGAMWYDGSLYVAAPPSIWRLTDTDGDGVADRREEWFQGKTLTTCANDLHGPYLGPDGWIYWTKGAFAQQTYERPGRAPLVTRAAHIFRRRPGDSVVEAVMTGGMDNPVDVAFTPSGERILTATFLEHPQLGRRDAVIHAIYGGVYGKPHAVVDGHPRTGDLMPEISALGPAAPAGLTRYASRAFGAEYRDNFFAALFNLHKVTRHALEPDGATFKSRDSDFVVSSSLDFHPTDVIDDADGSLLVVDTGAWYKLCCPTSQLAKPEVLGAIYRVRRRGAPAVSDPRGRRIAWDRVAPSDLAGLLDDSRPAVQGRAVQQLAARGSAAIEVLERTLTRSTSVEARRNAVWALTRVSGSDARTAVRRALGDRDDSVRQAAMHSAAVWRDAAAVPQLLEGVASGRPHFARAAAEALGRIGDARAVPSLLTAAAQPNDRVLEHSLTFALIEIADPKATAAGLEAGSSRTKRAALIALDQMEGGRLAAETVLPALDSPDPLIKDTAWWIAARHQDWGASLAAYFRRRLTTPPSSPSERAGLEHTLAQFSAQHDIQELVADTADRAASKDVRLGALRVMGLARPKELPARWTASLVRALDGGDAEIVSQAVAVARGTPSSAASAAGLTAALLRVSRDERAAVDVRLDALGAAPGGLASVDPAAFDLLSRSLAAGENVSTRTAASRVAEKAKFSRDQLVRLLPVVESAGPMELPRLLAAFENAADEALGLDLVGALSRSKGRSGLRADVLRPRLAKYPASVQRQGDALLATLDADAAAQARRLEETLASLPAGDIARGQVIFNQPRAACMACHAIGYAGGRVGPDLTRIGQIRSERDLLEAIMYPSASFARSYEPVVVETSSGERSGVLRGDAGDEIVIAVGAGEEIRIPRRDVDDVRPGTVSIMPAGLAEQLTKQELADLLAFLKATRSGAH